jgi:hypothetical protein
MPSWFVSQHLSSKRTISKALTHQSGGFADITVSTNLARDLGTRMVAAIFFGKEAFTYKNYSWIAILINVPATFFGTCIYEIFLRDSLQKLGKGGAYHEDGEEGLRRHLTQQGFYGDQPGIVNATGVDHAYTADHAKDFSNSS